MIRVFISSVQREFAEGRQLLCKYIREDALLGKFFQDRLKIWNPEILPDGLTIPQLEEPHKSQPHNPLIAEPMFLKGYIEKAGTGAEDIISKCVNYGLERHVFRQDFDFKATIWRKQVIQKNVEVGQKTDEMTEKTPQVSQKKDEVSQKKDEVSQKIEQLSQKATQLLQKMSQKTFESIFYAINNDAYISIQVIAQLCECTPRTVIRYVNLLTENGFISHVGPDKGGYRIINWSKLY